MKTTTLAIIVVLTAMILVTAGAFNSPALAARVRSLAAVTQEAAALAAVAQEQLRSSGSARVALAKVALAAEPVGTSDYQRRNQRRNQRQNQRRNQGGTREPAAASGGTSGGTSGTVKQQLKSLITCLTSTSKTTGTLPSRAQFTSCEAQSNFGTLGGSTLGGSTLGGSTLGGAKTSGSGKASSGGGLVPLTSGVAPPSFLGTTGKSKTSGP